MKRLTIPCLGLVLILASAGCTGGTGNGGAELAAAAGPTEQARQRDKWGIYVMVNPDAKPWTRNLLRSHPLVRAVVLTASWAELEPEKGKYDLERLAGLVEEFGKAGKGVVLAPRFYSQDPVEGREIPAWVYRESGLRWLSFKGGGRAEGKSVRIPAVWDPACRFPDNYVEPLVRALARRFDGRPEVWYIQAALGHLGNLTVQPSPRGSAALLSPGSGWSPEVWQQYTRAVVGVYRAHFRSTPLLVIDEMRLLRDRARHHYQQEAARIIGEELVPAGVSIVQFQLRASPKAMQPFLAHVRALDQVGAFQGADKGLSRYGVGDDWPLWVPENRRDKGGTQGRDEEFLRRALAYALGGRAGLRPLPTTILFLQLPEVLASHPRYKDYRPEVYEILATASKRLEEKDRDVFGDKAR